MFDNQNDWKWINIDQLIFNQSCQPEKKKKKKKKNQSYNFLETKNEFLAKMNIPLVPHTSYSSDQNFHDFLVPQNQNPALWL